METSEKQLNLGVVPDGNGAPASEPKSEPVTLRDGTVIVPQPMNLDRFIIAKNLIARTLARGMAGIELDQNPQTGFKLLANVIESMGKEDILDMLIVLLGYEDREKLSSQFHPGLIMAGLQVLQTDLRIDLGSVLGEAQRSLGSQKARKKR